MVWDLWLPPKPPKWSGWFEGGGKTNRWSQCTQRSKRDGPGIKTLRKRLSDFQITSRFRIAVIEKGTSPWIRCGSASRCLFSNLKADLKSCFFTFIICLLLRELFSRWCASGDQAWKDIFWFPLCHYLKGKLGDFSLFVQSFYRPKTKTSFKRQFSPKSPKVCQKSGQRVQN